VYIDDRPERNTLWFQQYSNPQMIQGLLPIIELEPLPATEEELELELFFRKLKALCSEGKEVV